MRCDLKEEEKRLQIFLGTHSQLQKCFEILKLCKLQFLLHK